jgi:hypothetical protein
MKALRAVYPDIDEGEVNPKPLSKFYSYPRPISEPPSPSSSRVTTPAPSQHGSDDERDDDQVPTFVNVTVTIKPFSVTDVAAY